MGGFVEDPIIYESEFHREVTVRFPIGLPVHCIETNSSKSNRTPSDLQQLPCPSFCGQETGKTNQVVSDIPEAPEMVIPENIDLIETSTSFKVLQKSATTKLAPVERKSDIPELSTTMGNNQGEYHSFSLHSHYCSLQSIIFHYFVILFNNFIIFLCNLT